MNTYDLRVMRAAVAPPTPSYTFGLDLGQSRDYSALCVLEKLPGPTPNEPTLHCRHLHRWPLGTAYPTIVADVAERLRDPALADAGRPDLAIDATGVGRAVVDLFRRPGPAAFTLHAVTITGGVEVARHGRDYHVPKRDLVGTVVALLQTDRLRIAEGLPETATLVKELRDFRAVISAAGRDTYGVVADWREGQNDDLVLAVAIAAWVALNVKPGWARAA